MCTRVYTRKHKEEDFVVVVAYDVGWGRQEKSSEGACEGRKRDNTVSLHPHDPRVVFPKPEYRQARAIW